MSFYSKPVTYLTILAISGFALPVAKADEAKVSQSATKISVEPQQNPSTEMPSIPATTEMSTLAEKFATDTASLPQTTVLTPDKIQWMPGSNLLPVGSKVAMLEGDPAKDGPFTMRVKFPANYMNAPHVHSKVEHMTVISGTFNLGIGQKFDATKGTAMPAGSFVVIQPGVPHYGWGVEETVLQIHGIGPREKVFVEPVPVMPPAKTSY
ncbi:MAG TPA: cupin domain-containing protein [Gammaproteobacteria bacterium]|nr:cupin domain-containing protein [Gammaproteobacteria bacterium]